MGKHRHHHSHYHRAHHVDDSASWLWFLFFLVIIGVLIVFLFVPWWGWNNWDQDNDGQRFVAVSDGAPVMVEGSSSNNDFVFKKKRRNIAAKRTDRHRCKTGEMWSEEEQMCAPIFNVPVAFEGTIMNVTMNMCDDFFNSMCGTWNAEHTDEDRTFSYGYHRNQAAIRRLILGSSSSIRRFYDSCMASARGDAAAKHESEVEIKHVLEHISGALRGYADLPVVFGRLMRYGYTAPFVFSIERDPMHKRVLPFFAADSSFLNVTSSTVTHVFEEARSVTHDTSLALLDKVRRTLKVIHFLNRHNTEPVEGIVDFMSYLRDGGLQDDMHTFKELGSVWFTPQENAGAWTGFFQALDGSALRLGQEQPVWAIGVTYLKWLFKEGLSQLEVLDWQAYVQFSIFYNGRQFYPELPNNVYLHEGLKIGNTKKEKRSQINNETLCLSVTQHMLPGLVAEAFLRDMMPNKQVIRAQVKEMVERILNVYKGIIQSTAWLSQPDKDVALNKLGALIVRVIEPDEWEPEPFAQRISADRYDHNMNMIRRYRVHRNVQLWHKDDPDALDRNALATFVAPLSDVNAYYSPSSNTITILAGILQKPFYNVEYDEPTRYAIVGSIIGHELGHMFDPHGLYWDADGSFKAQGIWSAQGMQAFQNKTRCVVKEFGDVPKECAAFQNIDQSEDAYGLSTLGEDLADLIGVRLSYSAYFDYTTSHTTQGQRQYFFMTFAQAWCASYSVEQKCALVTGDVHAIAEYRVDRTLRNLPEWQRVFGCPRKQVCEVFT